MGIHNFCIAIGLLIQPVVVSNLHLNRNFRPSPEASSPPLYFSSGLQRIRCRIIRSRFRNRLP
jgi:hypothetical protein